MAEKEATARIKINKLLEETGWRFLDDENGQANIQLEPNAKITESDIDAFGQDFETTKNGFVDFLLLDENNFPLVVLEAKKEEKIPLMARSRPESMPRVLMSGLLFFPTAICIISGTWSVATLKSLLSSLLRSL